MKLDIKSVFQNKKLLRSWIKNTIYVTIGCFILALGNAMFIVPANLLTGGIASIGIIIQHFINAAGSDFKVVDLVNWGFEILCFLIGLIFLGKKFAAHTLYASLMYPAFYSLMYRTGWFNFIAESLIGPGAAEPMVGFLLCSVFGGVLVGLGVAVTFLGGGSTGGLDVLAILIAKHTPIKESVGTFILDGSLVATGIICMWNSRPNMMTLGLIGIISAFVCAFMIQVVYVSGNSFFAVEVISDHYGEIVAYIQDTLDRGCTILHGEGAYTGAAKSVIKVALSKEQAAKLKSFISSRDPKAFMIINPASSVNGEGFVPFATPRASIAERLSENQGDVE